MERKLSLLLLAALLAALLTGCGGDDPVQTPESSGIFFYYRYAQTMDFKAGAASLGTETHTLYPEDPEIPALLGDYLSGPNTAELKAALPEDTMLAGLKQEGETLTVRLMGGYEKLTGIDRTLADACLTLTLTQLEGVEQVVLCGGQQSEAEAPCYRPEDFAILDVSSSVSSMSVKLYFADTNDRYLLPELRQTEPTDVTGAAEFVVDQLIAGPAEEGHGPVMPRGARRLNLRVENGLCLLDLSAEFVAEKPATEAGEWMTVYALVNSLTELEGIESVQLLCEGSPISYYRYMKLDLPLRAFEGLVGPVRYGMSEFDADLFVGSWSADYLARIPVRLQQTTAQSQQVLLVQTLLDYQPPEGFVNLMPAGTRMLSAEVSDGVCTVDLSREFLGDASDTAAQRLRVNALTASLCSLSDVDAVVILIDSAPATMGLYDLREPLKPAQDWFFPK